MRDSGMPCVFRVLRACLILAGIALLGVGTNAQTIAPKYQKPPKNILDVLNAPVTPDVAVSPKGDVALFYTPVPYPSIAELSRPMLRLAGVRIDPANNGQHNAPRFANYALKRIAGSAEIHVSLPANAYLSVPTWSPDGSHFSFTNTTPKEIQLWVGEASDGAAHQLGGILLNSTLGAPCQWTPDSRSLLCLTVPPPSVRGAEPKANPVPPGPRIEESYGKAAPQPTYEDLLENDLDQKLFDYYATSQLALVNVASGDAEPVGNPAIFGQLRVSPDGLHILVARIHRPFSYLVPFESFAKDVEVWDRTGKVVFKVASVASPQETEPLGGVPTGPRNVDWQPSAPATLVWAEALDGGDPRAHVTPRDKVMRVDLAKGAAEQPAQMLTTEERFAGILWGERGDFAIVRDTNRRTAKTRSYFFNPKDSPIEPRLAWDLNVAERYKNPGLPVMRMLPSGQRAIAQSGDDIYLDGPGASPEGDRPFLDRVNTKTLESTRLFHCDENSYESFVALLAPDGSKFLTRHETPTDPPNYFVHSASGAQAFTHFADPVPQLRAIKKQIVTYQRNDGVGLSMELYLPPDYKAGTRYPAVMWAYPREFADSSVASEVEGSPNRFTVIRGYSELFFLLDGYVVLDNATLPVVGDPETVNNTYVEQIVAGAKAAIDKAADMGVIDPSRVGVGGHSYGAFMTANLLAHSDLFKAGIAESGAYNRTLTPFGFQNERRTLWQASDVYLKMSPFMYADKIKAPILLIHGEADNNSGTFPIQSDRMYRAIKGNGGDVRYVTLPFEAHGYAARETIEDVLWEKLTWFGKYVKNAGGQSTTAAGAAR